MKSFNLIVLIYTTIYTVQEIDCQNAPECLDDRVSYIPHNDCTKYYVCDSGHQVVMDCPETLYFNPRLQICDYPYMVPECVSGTRSPSGSSTTVSTSHSTTTETLTTQRTTAETLTTPRSTTESTTEIQTTTSLTTQPPPTSTERSTTQEPSTPSTPRSTTEIQTTPSLTTQPPSISTEKLTTQKPSTLTTALPNGCPPIGIVKIPDPSSCSTFFICVNGIPHPGRCPEDLLFNPDIKECDLPENVDLSQCTPSTTTSPTTLFSSSSIPDTTTETNPQLPTCPDSGIVFLPFPGNCTLYIMCADGVTVIQTCPEGTCFEEDISACALRKKIPSIHLF